jgi:hypothetical protein
MAVLELHLQYQAHLSTMLVVAVAVLYLPLALHHSLGG